MTRRCTSSPHETISRLRTESAGRLEIPLDRLVSTDGRSFPCTVGRLLDFGLTRESADALSAVLRTIRRPEPRASRISALIGRWVRRITLLEQGDRTGAAHIG